MTSRTLALHRWHRKAVRLADRIVFDTIAQGQGFLDQAAAAGTGGRTLSSIRSGGRSNPLPRNFCRSPAAQNRASGYAGGTSNPMATD